MKNIFFFLTTTFIITAMIACSAPKGDTGLPGAAGIDGLDGVNGQDGTDGIDGANGQDGTNGNGEINFMTFYFPATSWVSQSYEEAYIDFQVPIVTAEIANSGFVMAYLLVDRSIPLPLDINGQQILFWANPGLVRVTSYNFYGAEKPAGGIRIVAATADGLARHPNLDWSDYNTVKAAFNLSE